MSTEILLIPEGVHADLAEAIRDIAPRFECLAYSEDGVLPSGTSEAVAVLRWVAGKRFSTIIEKDAPCVRWLHTASAGVDHVLTPAVLKKCQSGDLALTDSGPAFGIAIGEFVLAWMLSVSHGLTILHQNKLEKKWQGVRQDELYGQTAGIIGLGPIGQGIAERCRAIGMRTMGYRRNPVVSPSVDETLTGPQGLCRMMKECDWIIIAAALTGETRRLIGTDEFAQMKTSAVLVNIARGGLVDEEALITALQNGRIAGACLDVFSVEPLPQDSPLWDIPSVHIAPHNSSGWAQGLRERQKRLFLENVSLFASGNPLAGVVDIARGY